MGRGDMRAGSRQDQGYPRRLGVVVQDMVALGGKRLRRPSVVAGDQGLARFTGNALATTRSPDRPPAVVAKAVNCALPIWVQKNRGAAGNVLITSPRQHRP